MTDFAEKVHAHIEALETAGKLSKRGTGRFDPLIRDIATHLGVGTDEVYVVACARPNNLNIRLTQGTAQHRHNVIGLGVLPNGDNRTVLSGLKAGASFIGNGKAQYDAVGVIIKQDGKWVIGGIVEANTANVAAKLKPDFPALVEKSVQPVTAPGTANAATNAEGMTGGAASAASILESSAVPTPYETTAAATALNSLVHAFHEDLKSAQLVFSDALITRFCASLLARRFLILTGLSGSGKTKLAEAFARWLSPGAENSFHKIVPVGADWTSNEQVLGYPDALHAGRYETRPTLDLLLHAAQSERENLPHFLVLDEMNLSHVERYFSDFLSVMETGAPLDLYSGEARGKVSSQLFLPRNLYIAGTVNVDETTYLFSPKVLDRANVIEFRAEEDEIFNYLETFSAVDLSKIDARGAKFVEPFMHAARLEPHLTEEDKDVLAEAFRRIFRVTSLFGREFGFRTLHDVSRFIFYYRMLVGDENWDIDEAIDAQIYQRVLPRLYGSRAQVQLIIWALGAMCLAGDLNDADFENQILKPLQQGSAIPNPFEATGAAESISSAFAGAKYPMSAEKLYRMERRLRDGFVSFMEA